MLIEKNDDGNYVLTCCFGELLEIYDGLRCSARIESHVKPELLDKKRGGQFILNMIPEPGPRWQIK